MIRARRLDPPLASNPSRAPASLESRARPRATAFAIGASALLASACATEQPPSTPSAKLVPLTRAIASAAGPSAAPPPAEAPREKKTKYSGHGASSVPREVIARYAPPALPDDVAQRIQAILDVRAPSAGQLTPDGKTLFFSWNVTGTRQLWRLDGPQRFPLQITAGDDQVSLADVAPDGTFLVVSRDRKGEENPGVYLQDVKGGPLTVVQHKPGAQTFADFVSDDSRYVYFRSNDVRPDAYTIYRYDRTTKARETVLDQPGLWEIVDHKADGRLLLQKRTGEMIVEVFEWTPSTKRLEPLFGQGEKEEYEARYGAGNDLLVLTPKPSEYRRLYRWDRAGRKLAPVSPDVKHDVNAFTIDRSQKRVLYTINEDGYTRLHAMDARTGQAIALPAMDADRVGIGAMSKDGRLATISVDSGRGPAHAFVLDIDQKKLVPWNAPSVPEVDPSKLVRAKLESYPARDGTKIPMFVSRPRTCAATPCPVLVLFHGGPEAQTLAGYNTLAQLFTDAGFVFVQPNVRGSDGYGKAWIHADDGPKRLDVLTDIEDCSKFVRAQWGQGGKEPKVGVLGWSYGGYSTLVAMTMFAGAYDAGAASVGIGNLVTFLENTAPYRRALRTSEYGDPERDRDALVKLSPTTYIDKVRSPLLVMQGASDPRVPVGEAIQIHEALEAKKIPSQLVIFEGEGHGTQKRDNRVLELGHMLRFFQAHLLGAKTG